MTKKQAKREGYLSLVPNLSGCVTCSPSVNAATFLPTLNHLPRVCCSCHRHDQYDIPPLCYFTQRVRGKSHGFPLLPTALSRQQMVEGVGQLMVNLTPHHHRPSKERRRSYHANAAKERLRVWEVDTNGGQPSTNTGKFGWFGTGMAPTFMSRLPSPPHQPLPSLLLAWMRKNDLPRVSQWAFAAPRDSACRSLARDGAGG